MPSGAESLNSVPLVSTQRPSVSPYLTLFWISAEAAARGSRSVLPEMGSVLDQQAVMLNEVIEERDGLRRQLEELQRARAADEQHWKHERNHLLHTNERLTNMCRGQHSEYVLLHSLTSLLCFGSSRD